MRSNSDFRPARAVHVTGERQGTAEGSPTVGSRSYYHDRQLPFLLEL